MHQKYSGWFAVLVIVSGVFIVFSFLGDGGITGAVVGNFDESVEQSVSVSSCGTVSSDINFSFDITATGDCFVIESSDIVIDGAGYSLIGNGSGSAFILGDYQNITITNFSMISGFTIGFENESIYNNITGTGIYDYNFNLSSGFFV
ncbi:hypothetical protein HOC01_05290 [archaeon]|jgi:hypothetical protein|nr:hypothetical protein [archaeon]